MAEPASFAFGAARLWPRSERRAEPRPARAQPARCQGSAARQALTVFFVRRVSAGLLYLSQIALARWMGAYDYGVYVLVWTWVLVLGNLSNLGLSTAVVRLVPQHRARGENAALRGLFFAGRLLVVAVASGIALIGFGVLWCVGKQVATPTWCRPCWVSSVCPS
jgi:Polysaccharide biosynthesis protein